LGFIYAYKTPFKVEFDHPFLKNMPFTILKIGKTFEADENREISFELLKRHSFVKQSNVYNKLVVATDRINLPTNNETEDVTNDFPDMIFLLYKDESSLDDQERFIRSMIGDTMPAAFWKNRFALKGTVLTDTELEEIGCREFVIVPTALVENLRNVWVNHGKCLKTSHLIKLLQEQQSLTIFTDVKTRIINGAQKYDQLVCCKLMLRVGYQYIHQLLCATC